MQLNKSGFIQDKFKLLTDEKFAFVFIYKNMKHILRYFILIHLFQHSFYPRS